jgi:hypothetical protein
MAGQSLIVHFVLAPDDQRTYFVQLNFIIAIAFPFFGWRAMCKGEWGVFGMPNTFDGSFYIDMCCQKWNP